MKKLLFSVLISLNVLICHSLTLTEQIAIYISQQQYGIIYDMAEQIYKNTSDYRLYTTDELYTLSIAAAILYTQGDSITGYQYAEAPAKWFLNKYGNVSQSFYRLPIDKKKELIIEMNKDYSSCQTALLLLRGEYAKQVSSLHHNFVVKNRNLIDDGTIDGASKIIQILSADLLWMELHGRMEMAVLSHFPALMELPRRCRSYNEKMLIAVGIAGVMKLIQPEIMNYAFLAKNDTNTYLYLPAITDFLLVQQELELFITGHRISEKYYEVSWKQIQKALESNDVAVLMFETQIAKLVLEGYIEISPNSSTPSHSIVRVGSLIQKPIDFSSYNDRKVYISIPYYFSNFNEDIIYTSANVYLKNSLLDLARKDNEKKKYNGGTIEIMADLNIGSSSKLPPLHDANRLIQSLSHDFPDRTYVLSGNDVRKINFLNLNSEIEILHISTHGEISLCQEGGRISSNNIINDILLGNANKELPFLCLSNYNGICNENTLSVNDILTSVSFEEQGLVFLDACNTSYSISTSFGGLASLARACYIKGAQNIISYLSPINEIVATDFAMSFYKKMADNPNVTYHDAFYQTKKEIIEKFKNTAYLRKDYKNDRPQLDIVLWE